LCSPVLTEPLIDGCTVSWVLPTSQPNDAAITGMVLRVADADGGAVVAEVSACHGKGVSEGMCLWFVLPHRYGL
jgi:hypothetical protein